VAWGLFDEQGRRLVIATEAGIVRLIDAASGRQLFEANVACEIDRIKYGDVLVVVCKDGPIHSIDAETGRALTRFELDGAVVQFSPNAQMLLTFDKNRNLLKLVETRSGHHLASVDTPSDFAPFFLSTYFSNDSRHVAMPTVSGDVRLVDSDDLPSFHTQVWLDLNHQGRAILSHDGRLLAVDAPDRFVRIIDVATQQEVGLLQHAGSAIPIAFSPNDRLLVMYQDFTTVHLMDISSSKEIVKLPCKDSSVTSSVLHLGRLSREDSTSSVFDRAVFSSDSRLFAIQCDNVAQVIETDSGKALAQVQYGEKPAGLALSPDGRLLATTSAREGKARLTEVASGQDRFPITLESGAYPLDVVFSPDGRTLALGLLGHVRLIDIATGKERVRLPPESAGGMSLRPSFSPDGRILAAEYKLPGYSVVFLFETTGGRELLHIAEGGKLEVSGYISSTFSPDSRFFAVGFPRDSKAAGQVRLFETATGKEMVHLDLGAQGANVAFSPDSRYLAAAGGSGATKLWQIDSRQERAHIQHAGAVNDFRFSPDSRLLATASQDGSIRTTRTTETATGQEVARFEHGKPVWKVEFLPTGQWMMSRSADTIRLSDGTTKPSSDGTTRLWWADPNWPFQQLCMRTGSNLSQEDWRAFIGPDEPWRPTCEH
jgi:WD40 repeat protein